MRNGPLVTAILSTLLCVWPSGSVDATPAKPRRAKANVQKTTAGGPQLAYERFRRTVQIEVAQKREDQIAGLLRLLDLGAPKEEQPDLKFRLAELYSDKSRFYFFRGQEKDDEIARITSEQKKKSLRAEKEEALRESKVWARQALEVYAEIRKKHPKYARTPEVLFALGQSYWTQGEFEAALRPYADLIRQYRESPLVAEAWIAFGEFYFNQGNVRKALKSYQNAAENKRSRVYGFALYKQAWCFYNMAEWTKALRKFEATVLFSQLSEEMSGENKLALGREAQADWVRTYVHTGTSENARFEIARLLDLDSCTGRCLKLLEGLANLWYEEGYFDESADVYRQLVRLDSTSLRNPLRQARVVDLVDRMGDKKKTVLASKRLVDVFQAAQARHRGLAEDAPERVNSASDLEEAEIVAETTLRRLAQEWNKEARKTRQNETFERAETMYADYLALFPDSKRAYKMRFQYADLLYKLEKFDEAAVAYRAVVEARPKKGEHLAEAANDNILAIDEHLKDLRLKLPGDLKVATPLHPQHQRLVDATTRYLELVPKADALGKLPAVKLKAARVYYAYNQFPTALALFEDIVKTHPRSEQAVVAANLVVDVHNLRKDWRALYESARKYLDDRELMEGRPRLNDQLRSFGEYAKFALVQQLEERVKKDGGDLRLVARGYEEFHQEFPASENADEALFNASVLRDGVGDKKRAAILRKQLLDDFPNSPLRADVAFYVAKRHEERTEFGRAAGGFRAFATEFPKDPRAKDALYNASVFYAGIGKVRTAAKLREKYLANYGRAKGGKKEAREIAYAIALDLDRSRRWRDAVREYKSFYKKYGLTAQGFDAMWREAQIRREHLRHYGAAEDIEKKLLGTVRWMQRKRRKVPPNALRHASLVAFGLLNEDFRDYRKLRLKTPNLRNPRPFQKSLRDKARSRDRLIRRYTAIVSKYKQAESSIASLYQIARSWDVFIDDLTKLPCPRGVTGEVCDEVRAKLEEMSLPARESAVAAYKACIDKSNKLETFTAYSTRCAKRLERIAPDMAPPMLEMRARFKAVPEVEDLPTNSLILEAADYTASSASRDTKLKVAAAAAARGGGQ